MAPFLSKFLTVAFLYECYLCMMRRITASFRIIIFVPACWKTPEAVAVDIYADAEGNLTTVYVYLYMYERVCMYIDFFG
jgi:hypothetical protein